MGWGLHNRPNHPIKRAKDRIAKLFPDLPLFDDLSPHVSVANNFDNLLISNNHESRSSSETYYLNNDTVLRTHTTAHLHTLLLEGNSGFLVAGDVYRKSEIDRYHYPAFHQLDAVKLCPLPTRELHRTVENLLDTLLPGKVYHRNEAYFPFAQKSWEYEVHVNDQWVEILSCGIIDPEIILNVGLVGEDGWSFGIGLDRLAMLMFDIPDIRMLWMNLAEGVVLPKTSVFVKNVTFWMPEDYNHNVFCEMVRDIGGDSIEFVQDTSSHGCCGRVSKSCRITYHSLERSLTEDEVNLMHNRICAAVTLELRGEIR